MTASDRARPSPANSLGATTFERLLTRAAQALLLVVGSALAPAVPAQLLMTLSNASIFEGNAGTSILKLPVNFATTSGTTNATTVTGTVSAIPLTGTGFNAATGGTACGPAGVDFEQFANVPFSIPPNTPNGTLSVNIRICSDAVIEPDEQIAVFLSNVAGGAFCTSESCTAIGTIVNDDGPPTVSINSISVSEPALAGLTRTASFTVSLHHPFAQDVSVHFATRDGTAKSGCSFFSLACPDYVAKSGTATVPASTATVTNLSTTIPITIRGDGIQEPDENFFVDLSAPTPAGVTILNATGRATIRDTTLTIGDFDLSPDDAVVENGDTVAFDLVWTVPEGETWRDLKSLDIRIGEGKPVLWVRWDEASNTFSLCEQGGRNAAAAEAEHHGPPVTCGGGAAPGTAAALATASAQLLLAETTVVGSGPTGRSVTLHLVVSFGPDIKAHTYPVELAAADDLGHSDRFVRAGEVVVE
jgi:Calx-beta domain-containing protein